MKQNTTAYWPISYILQLLFRKKIIKWSEMQMISAMFLYSRYCHKSIFCIFFFTTVWPTATMFCWLFSINVLWNHFLWSLFTLCFTYKKLKNIRSAIVKMDLRFLDFSFPFTTMGYFKEMSALFTISPTSLHPLDQKHFFWLLFSKKWVLQVTWTTYTCLFLNY